MVFDIIQKIDPNYESVGDKTDFTGICNANHLVDQHLLFAKNIKFYNSKVASLDLTSRNITLLVPLKIKEKIELPKGAQKVIYSDNIDMIIAQLSKVFFDQKYGALNQMVDGRQMGTAKVHPDSWIAQSCFIGEGVTIEQGVTVHAGAHIGAYSIIKSGSEVFPNTTIYPFTEIGKNCRIHAGVSIGADGFGYHFENGIHHKIYHMGGAILEDDVEIGANSCVDGGTFSPTRIGAGTKLDNHVQIGHNCQLGRGVIICGHVAIGGSSVIGDYTVFGGKSGMGDNMELGMACQVAGGALVNCDWPAKTVLGGHPARPIKEWMKGLAFVRKSTLRKNKD